MPLILKKRIEVANQENKLRGIRERKSMADDLKVPN